MQLQLKQYDDLILPNLNTELAQIKLYLHNWQGKIQYTNNDASQ